MKSWIRHCPLFHLRTLWIFLQAFFTLPDDGEEIILPGTKEEIGEFIEGACRNALIQLNVTLPSITIQLPSKHLYEVIYNRLVSSNLEERLRHI